MTDMPSTDSPIWRPARAADLPAIARIAAQIHPALPERAEIFAEKLALFPEGCFVLMRRGAPVGYGVSHPWRGHGIPPLDTFLTALPSAAECLFLHDVAILPEARGHGAGRFVEIVAAVAHARKLAALALVAVYGTQPLWSRLGFAVVPDPALAPKLEPYGEGAAYMVRRSAESRVAKPGARILP